MLFAPRSLLDIIDSFICSHSLHPVSIFILDISIDIIFTDVFQNYFYHYIVEIKEIFLRNVFFCCYRVRGVLRQVVGQVKSRVTDSVIPDRRAE